MKINSITSKAIAVTLFLMLGISSGMWAQEDEPLSTRLDLTCVQSLDTPIQLVAKLRAREEGAYVAVKGENIAFFIVTLEDNIAIGEAVTDAKGEARISIPDNSQMEMDEEGYYTVSAVYEGSDDYEESDEEFYFKIGYIQMVTSEEDDVRTVEATALEIMDGEEMPIADVELKVSVPMMFSNLPIGMEYTDEEGYVSFEFPNDLPGDENGDVKLVAEVLETDDFGILRTEEVKNWGIPKATVVAQSRELWTPDAPLWMVITFSVLMLAVWGHFIYIIYRLVGLKNEGRTETA